MTTQITNQQDFPLALAVHLAADTYDFKPDSKRLSSTDFTKSIRQLVLRNRMMEDDTLPIVVRDVSDLVKSKTGTAIHDSIEHTWTTPHLRNKGLKLLGYPDKIIERIEVNPTKEYLEEHPDCIPIYMEQRGEIEINGYTISGKFDFIGDGQLIDFKSTGTWKWDKLDVAKEDYQIQGSIYRLIFKDIITSDYLNILFWFTDWKQGLSVNNPKYPREIEQFKVDLKSTEETISFITAFTNQLEAHKHTPEPELPECTPEQMWQQPPVFKYFKNPLKTAGRSTRTSSDFAEIQSRYLADGSVGVIQTVESKPRRCDPKYCDAYHICTQKDKYID